MIPITQYQNDYFLAWEEVSDHFFILFNTTYDKHAESVCIQLPLNIKSQYIKEGHNNLVKWIKRIDNDYQVGRFSKNNPGLMTDYIQATSAQQDALINCFENNISLIEREVIRLLYLLDKDLAAGKVFHDLKEGKKIPIEIFCLAFRFYDSAKPLVDLEGNILLETASAKCALNVLEKSPVHGCPDAALMLLGSLPHQKNIVHLNCLHNIISEFNCRYIHEELSCFTAQAANFNYVTINDSQSGYGNLISQFQNTFPIWPNFLLKTSSCLENWSFMETTLVWQDEYLECLISAFATSGITLSRPASHNLICLLSGRDSEWANYSTNQAIKYCPVDTSEFTRETVSKPIFDSNHHEDFIVGVWQHYFYYFANTEYPKSLLRKVLGDFVLAWSRS